MRKGHRRLGGSAQKYQSKLGRCFLGEHHKPTSDTGVPETKKRTKRTAAVPLIWRYYAIVVTADGRDLNELLVSAGLARIYGTRTPLPDGRDSRTYLVHLRELETQAKAARRGAWGKGAVMTESRTDGQLTSRASSRYFHIISSLPLPCGEQKRQNAAHL